MYPILHAFFDAAIVFPMKATHGVSTCSIGVSRQMILYTKLYFLFLIMSNIESVSDIVRHSTPSLTLNDIVVNANSEQVVSLNSSVMLDVSEYKVLHVEHGVKTHAIFYIGSFFVI